MSALSRLRAVAAGATLAASAAGLMSLTGAAPGPLAPAPARAQGTPGLFEFRWDNNRDFRKLYFFMSETGRSKRAEYYLILRPKDRKTAALKLTVKLPYYWQAELDQLRHEIASYSEELAAKPFCVVFSKLDLLGEHYIPEIDARGAFGLYAISAAGRQGLDVMLDGWWSKLLAMRAEALQPEKDAQLLP